LVSVGVHVDLSPLGGVLDVWVEGSPVGWVLEGLRDTVIEPVGVRTAESWMSVVVVVRGPVAKSEVTSLRAELPAVETVLNVSSGFLIEELLGLVFLNPLLKVAWHSWEVVESWFVDSVLIFASDDQWCSLLLGGNGMKVHASSWLHGGGNWLSNLLGEFWDSVALNDLDIKVDIGSERDWLTTEWGPGESGTIYIVGWAVKMGLVSHMELWDSKIPAVEFLSSSEGESDWEASTLSTGA